MKKDILNADDLVVNTILLADGADYPLPEGWSLRDHVPAEVMPEPSAGDQQSVILSQLHQIDLRSIRALRTGETERLAELEAEATVLRNRLTHLTNKG
jgi:aminoglycoside phosphotransferase (APT) family kinase protein